MKDSKLTEYIKMWQNIEGIKPKNEPEFLDPFVEFLNGLDDCRDLSFDGEGAYFGMQVSIVKDYSYFGDPYLNFEIAYSKDRIVVYRGDNDGYCVPEYIDFRREREPEKLDMLLEIVKITILRLMDLNWLTTLKTEELTSKLISYIS